MKPEAQLLKDPHVSVVMPNLNQAQFLEVAVRSVLEQDYPHVDLTVADGMSTDGSVELLARLQREYGQRLRWISAKDNGAAHALNRALAMGGGDLVGWLNADDMYLQGAVSRAVSHFNAHPTHQMVYGYASHMDAQGRRLGAYPTKPPSVPLDEFDAGSFVCQPTVFMRREALQAVGDLDESLKTAFDFDLWLRFFKRFPRQVGLIRRQQAYSRLHPACMTQRLRRQVAVDGLKVTSQHLGQANAHWVQTHLNELCAQYPLGEDKRPLIKQIETLLLEAKPYLRADALKQILADLKQDRRLALAREGLAATVEPDGWVSRRVDVKYHWADKPAVAVLLQCKAAWPAAGRLRLKVRLPSGEVQSTSIDAPDDFVLRLEVGPVPEAGQLCWSIETQQGFIPASHDPASTDKRRLAFLVTGLGLEPPPPTKSSQAKAEAQ